ncbi:MAG: DUF1573 domain-containing protein [Bacteroidales bacterium]|jgi:hypothetical protein|nr:DUF1573 domain-containing protein [Bacteroidales bacterium]
MKKSLLIIILTFLTLLTGTTISYSQANNPSPLKFNEMIHNFGKILISEGPRSCVFKYENTGDSTIVIYNILTSCGCTTPQWDRAPVKPGQKGSIKITFSNDQGPFPFDKIISVYTSASDRPIILKIRGIAYEKEKSVKEMFPEHIGSVGFRNRIQGMGEIEQGEIKSSSVPFANNGNKSIKLKFEQITPGFTVQARPSEIKAGDVGEIYFTADTRVKKQWGKTQYAAKIFCNGIQQKKPFVAEALIIDNFSGLSEIQKAGGSLLSADKNVYDFGKIPYGKTAKASFSIKNEGKNTLIIHKADSNSDIIKVSYPAALEPGRKGTLSVTLPVNKLKGEQVFTITLITNSPIRPLVNFFVSGKFD